MSSFAEDTRVNQLDHGLYEAVLDPDWGIWGPNGGYLGAVALRAVGQHCTIDMPVSDSCHYANVAEFGKVPGAPLAHAATLAERRRGARRSQTAGTEIR